MSDDETKKDESTEPQDETPQDETPQDETPQNEPAPAEPNPEDDLPWKERLRLQKSRRSRKERAADPGERKAERVVERNRKAELRRKQRTAAKAAHTAGTGTPPAERESNAAKVRQGIVVSS